MSATEKMGTAIENKVNKVAAGLNNLSDNLKIFGDLQVSCAGIGTLSNKIESNSNTNRSVFEGLKPYGSKVKETLKKAIGGNEGNNHIKICEYGILKNDKTVLGQVHHLNQNAAYRNVIPSEKGISVKLKGNAFTQPGTQHYNAHESMEKFWNQFRRGGSRYGEKPTNLEYSKAVFDSMKNSDFTRQEALEITRQEIKQRIKYGLLGGESVPRIPGRINQVK